MPCRYVLLLLLFSWYLATTLNAQPVISRDVISSGGADMTDGTYRISGTAGQAIIGISTSSARIAGQGFWYQIASTPTAIDQVSPLPAAPALHQNYPNPFNPSTTIEFTLPERSHVRLVLYRATGELLDVLIDVSMQAGHHFVRFEAMNLPAGVYLYRMTSGSYSAERKMLLLK